MLEELALKLLYPSDNFVHTLFFAIIALSAIGAAAIPQKRVALSRTPYCVYWCLIIFLVCATDLIRMHADAFENAGALWTLALLNLSECAAVGFVVCRIAKARSRDAYGTPWAAALAFIPIIGFWLMLKGTAKNPKFRQAAIPRLFQGRRGKVVGLLLLLATAMIDGYVEQQSKNASNFSTFHRQISVNIQIPFLNRHRSLVAAAPFT